MYPGYALDLSLDTPVMREFVPCLCVEIRSCPQEDPERAPLLTLQILSLSIVLRKENDITFRYAPC